MATGETPQWQLSEVQSPQIDHSVPVIAARNIPYTPNANRLQNLTIYLPKNTENLRLIGSAVTSLPQPRSDGLPNLHVHIHGGAWRDPQLNSTSIDPAVAHAFSAGDSSLPIMAVASINYTLSPFPTHPTLPYDPAKGDDSDPAREAKHPAHIHDVLSAFKLLRSLGLRDGSYILTGHSCGACLSFQSILQSPAYWGFDAIPDPPRPAAHLGMNGLYDLPGLVYELGESHAQLEEVYRNLQGIAFGPDESLWPAASPARLPLDGLVSRFQDERLPPLVVLDQSKEDQLVPMNQVEKLEAHLKRIEGIRVVRGTRCKGRHAAPWEEGYMIWDSIQDILKLIKDGK